MSTELMMAFNGMTALPFLPVSFVPLKAAAHGHARRTVAGRASGSRGQSRADNLSFCGHAVARSAPALPARAPRRLHGDRALVSRLLANSQAHFAGGQEDTCFDRDVIFWKIGDKLPCMWLCGLIAAHLDRHSSHCSTFICLMCWFSTVLIRHRTIVNWMATIYWNSI